MGESAGPVRVKHADQVDDGVLVEFDDGRRILFSAEAMMALIPHGRDVTGLTEE